MTTIERGLRKLGCVASSVAMMLVISCSIAVASDIPLVDGTHWMKSTDDVKKAYLVGVSNVIQLEVAYQADNPIPEGRSLAPRAAKQLHRPVLETIWFEMVVPGLKMNK